MVLGSTGCDEHAWKEDDKGEERRKHNLDPSDVNISAAATIPSLSTPHVPPPEQENGTTGK
jgi:hypothetical protein